MAITSRPFSPISDPPRMLALANQCAAENLHVTDLPYRLCSWALDDPGQARLWFDQDGQLAAWAVLQTPFWTVDIVCRPQAEAEVYPEILVWADQRARETAGTTSGHPSWFVNVFTGQAGRILALEEAGFQCQADLGEDSWSKVLLRRPAQTQAKMYSPPAGYCVRALAGEAEAPAYVELHQSVFESKNMTLEWRRRTLSHPAYRPNLDIVVAAPDGRLAAFCICWLNENGLDGQVEPLGCHKNFRQFALGRVALAEGLRRLQALGVQNIYVETDTYRNTAFLLYKLLGFKVIQDVLMYRKDYSD